MTDFESKNEIDQLISSLEGSGVTGLFGVSLQQAQTRKGGDRLDVIHPTKTFFIDDQTGLKEIKKGNAEFLLEKIAKLAPSIAGDVSAVDLLGNQRFQQACFTEIDSNIPLQPNKFFQELAGVSTVPVFYGSTAGINFSEVLETTLCAQELVKRGVPATVIFDFDGSFSLESDRIFRDSLNILTPAQKERMINFSQGSLIEKRVEAVSILLSRLNGLPEVRMVNTLSVFEKLRDRFTMGQLLILGKIAGSNPRLFTKDRLPLNVNTLTSGLANQDLGIGNIQELFGVSVNEMIQKGFQPAGFTYYARETVIGKFTGLACVPLKLTEKANIYKVLFSTDSLFNPTTDRGIALLPITRFRIQSSDTGGPVDPIALMVLAQDEPQAFSLLMQEFMDSFRVLTPEEAIKKGTIDKKFLLGKHFGLGGINE